MTADQQKRIRELHSLDNIDRTKYIDLTIGGQYIHRIGKYTHLTIQGHCTAHKIESNININDPLPK